jgi:hypothetical protein
MRLLLVICVRVALAVAAREQTLPSLSQKSARVE